MRILFSICWPALLKLFASGLFYYYYYFIFSLHWVVFVAVLRLSLLAVSKAGATLHFGMQTSHCGGFSGCSAQVLGTWASAIVARRPSSCGSWAAEQTQSVWYRSLVFPRQGGSSRTMGGTRVPDLAGGFSSTRPLGKPSLSPPYLLFLLQPLRSATCLYCPTPFHHKHPPTASNCHFLLLCPTHQSR